MMRAVSIGLAFLTSGFCLGAPSTAQFISVLEVEPVKVKMGQTVKAVVPIRIKDGFHIQSNPPSKPNIATQITFATFPGVTIGTPEYPAGQPYRLETSDREILTYEGNLEIPVPITVSSKLKAGKRVLKGTVRYQACDTKICYFPSKSEFSVSLVVIP